MFGILMRDFELDDKKCVTYHVFEFGKEVIKKVPDPDYFISYELRKNPFKKKEKDLK